MKDEAAEMLNRVDYVIRNECRRHVPPPMLDHDDLAQEARIAFVKSYDEHGPFPLEVARRWAKIETRRRCIDAIRNARLGRRKQPEMQARLRSLQEVIAEGEHEDILLGDTVADARLEVDDGALAIQDAIRGLPETERLLVLGRLEGYRHGEMARWFGFTESRACQLLMKARARLEGRLDYAG